jgi:pyruvate, water dikinase
MTTQNPTLKGIPASQGEAEGEVKIVFDMKDNAKFNEGDVLVTKMTEPSMVPIMIKAAAIVTDVGGITCHAAIVSREMGTPCVVATKEATTKLQDGQKVRVDGTNGEVYII